MREPIIGEIFYKKISQKIEPREYRVGDYYKLPGNDWQVMVTFIPVGGGPLKGHEMKMSKLLLTTYKVT